jgi:hypothetical protein
MQTILVKSGRRATDPLVAMTVTEEGEPTMAKAQAKAKSAAMKEAVKKISTTPYKHTSHEGEQTEDTGEEGVDSTPGAVVQSENGGAMSAIASQLTPKEPTMQTQTTPGTDGVAKAAQIKADKDALKAQKAKERADKLAADRAAREQKIAAEKAEKARVAAEKKAEREKIAAEAKAKRDAEKVEKPARERTYDGSMLSLSDRVKAGAYVKGSNGQLRSTDDVALAFDAVPAKRVVPLALEFFGLTAASNPYAHLNYGQQSMNLRNKIRGAIRKDTEIEIDGAKVKLTLDRLKQLRDDGGYTAEAPNAADAPKA